MLSTEYCVTSKLLQDKRYFYLFNCNLTHNALYDSYWLRCPFTRHLKPDILLHWMESQYLGKPRNNMWSQDRLVKLSIRPSLLLLVNSYGSDAWLLSDMDAPQLGQHGFIMTTKWLVTLPITQSFTNTQNVLRWILLCTLASRVWLDQALLHQ